MRVKIDLDKIVEVVRRHERPRGQVTLYLDRPLVKDFQRACKRLGISVGRTIEEFMKQVVDHSSKK